MLRYPSKAGLFLERLGEVVTDVLDALPEQVLLSVYKSEAPASGKGEKPGEKPAKGTARLHLHAETR